jgi:DNA primase
VETWDGRGFSNEKKARSRSLEAIKKAYDIRQVLLVLSGNAVDVPSGHTTGWASVRCPFHEDRKPSASINLVDQRFVCHSCLVGGDIFDLVLKCGRADGIKGARDWITTNV